MTWLWVILAVGVIAALIGYFSSGGDAGDAAETGLAAAFGCGSVILQIFLAVLGIGLLFSLFGWLFGGCS